MATNNAVHYRDLRYGKTVYACGVYKREFRWTRDGRSVTCRRCRRYRKDRLQAKR